MTVLELFMLLEGLVERGEGDTEVKVVQQIGWPLKGEINAVCPPRNGDEVDDPNEVFIVVEACNEYGPKWAFDEDYQINV